MSCPFWAQPAACSAGWYSVWRWESEGLSLLPCHAKNVYTLVYSPELLTSLSFHYSSLSFFLSFFLSLLRQHVRLLRQEDSEFLRANIPDTFLPFLDSAITHHNIVCASHLYDNITVTQLGELLQLDPKLAEKETSNLILKGVIKGSISQKEGIIFFKTGLFLPFVETSVYIHLVCSIFFFFLCSFRCLCVERMGRGHCFSLPWNHLLLWGHQERARRGIISVACHLLLTIFHSSAYSFFHTP